MTRNLRFQPLTDLTGAIVFDRLERCAIGHFASLAEAVKAAKRMASDEAQCAAAGVQDRITWRALTR